MMRLLLVATGMTILSLLLAPVGVALTLFRGEWLVLCSAAALAYGAIGVFMFAATAEAYRFWDACNRRVKNERQADYI